VVLLVGTYTRDTASEGIYAFNWASGTLTQSLCNTGIDNPSFVIKHPTRNVIYCVNEIRDDDGEKRPAGRQSETGGSGGASAYALGTGGALHLINRTSSLGLDPCHLESNDSGSLLLVSNYSSGSLAAFSLGPQGEIGDLCSFIQHSGKSVDPMRQKGPHVHSTKMGKKDAFVYVADLGLDQLIRYAISASGQIDVGARKNARLKSGAGPRHFCFDAAFESCYLINELDNTVVAFALDDRQLLVELATYSALPADYGDASYCAEIQLSRDGRFLYGANRGHDSIVVFKVLGNGELKLQQFIDSGGRHPRHFSMTPDGDHLIVANRDSDNLVVFQRDRETGLLTNTGIVASVPAPVCLLFV